MGKPEGGERNEESKRYPLSYVYGVAQRMRDIGGTSETHALHWGDKHGACVTLGRNARAGVEQLRI